MTEWDELNELIENDPCAKACAMGLSEGEMSALERLRGLAPFSNPEMNDTDIGNARLFAAFWEGRLCWVRERRCWFTYENGVWQEDTGGLSAMGMCKRWVLYLDALAGELADAVLLTAAKKRVFRLMKRSVREALLRDAQDLMPQSLAAFDTDPWLFNCLNGTLDLRTGILRPHDARDRLTAMAGAAYDPQAVCPRWEQFVMEIMHNHSGQTTLDELEEVRAKAVYLQKLMGYSLTGDTSRECMYMFYGPSTRNGKGTLVETMVRLLGSYARTARPETLAVVHNRSGSAPNEDVARLRGARFVSMSEPDYGQKLNVALIKRLTGNDTITARFLHENSFEFRPEFKLFLSTNHLLSVSDPTLFASGRLTLIPFQRHFAEHERDHGLKAAFAKPEALSAVLNWCLEGLALVHKEGLSMPDCLQAAVSAYADEVDMVSQFMGECMQNQPGAKTAASAVYKRYQLWCEENGYQPENSRWFRKRLEEKCRLGRGRIERGREVTKYVADWLIVR